MKNFILVAMMMKTDVETLGIDKEKILTKYSKEEYEMAVKEMEKK